MADPAAVESDQEMGYSSDDDDYSNSATDAYFACSFCLHRIAAFLHLHFRYSVNTAYGVKGVGVFSGVNNVLVNYEAVEGHGSAVTVHCLTCLSFLGWRFVNLRWRPDPSFCNGRFLFIMDKLSLFPPPT